MTGTAGSTASRESFDTVAEGGAVVEHPETGEVVRVDDVGVTCRRRNWREARRTALTLARTATDRT